MVDNPRFPHEVEIYRTKKNIDGTIYVNPETGEEEKYLVLQSKCGLRDLVRGTDVDLPVIKADYKLALPRTEVVINVRDEVYFNHSYTNQIIVGEVEAFKTFNFGTNIWFQSNLNKHGE